MLKKYYHFLFGLLHLTFGSKPQLSGIKGKIPEVWRYLEKSGRDIVCIFEYFTRYKL